MLKNTQKQTNLIHSSSLQKFLCSKLKTRDPCSNSSVVRGLRLGFANLLDFDIVQLLGTSKGKKTYMGVRIHPDGL
jgi:hypothetical protein